MFTSTKRELGELYTLLRLLADGQLAMGTPDVKETGDERTVAYIQRAEHDGARRYHIGKEFIHIVQGDIDRKSGLFIPRAGEETRDFDRSIIGTAAQAVLALLKSSGGDEVEVPDEIEAFLDDLKLYDLEAKTEDRTDISIGFGSRDARPSGFVIRCRLSPMNPLLDGGRTANLKLEQTGVKFAVPTVNKINALPESPTEVTERMLMIERLGGVLKYSDVADRVFRANLMMIDLHFPRMMAECVRLMHLEGITRVPEVVERIKTLNPLKIRDELIQKHGYYEWKMKQFLLALALGMRPAKIYDGSDSAVEGMLLVTGEGRVLGYHKSERATFADFLYQNSRLERGPLEKDKYGFLERENGVWYFKLNLKIGLVKR